MMETQTTLLSEVKKAIRLSNSALDSEIQELIDSAKRDMQISGVQQIDETDTLIIRAIKLYAKANFGLDNTESEKFQQRYESLKVHLALCGEYNGAV